MSNVRWLRSKPAMPQKSPKQTAKSEALLYEVLQEVVLVQQHPRLLVLVAHGFIELLVNTIVEHKLKRGKRIASDSRTYPHSVKLVLLYETGIIKEKEYEAYDWYRGLRNKAAHEPLFTITEESFKPLDNPKYKKPEDLFQFSAALIGTLWNRHAEMLSPLFAAKEHVLLRKQPPNPSIERTSPGKPVAASHVKR
jgi:hypothetical protein